MFKKTKVVMLPTEKAVTSFYKRSNNVLIYRPAYYPRQGQHLYFLSDEEIKEGDWYYTSDMRTSTYGIHKAENKRLADIANEYGAIKIISSTDKLLGLPRPSDKFIQKYVELGGIDEVLVEYTRPSITLRNYSGFASNEEYDKTKPLILKVAPDNTITIKSVKNSWNRVEMEALFHRITQDLKGEFEDNEIRVSIQNFSNKWIEENL